MHTHENDLNEGVPPIDYNTMRKASLILKAINNQSRQTIIEKLIVIESSTVTNLINLLGMEQAVVSLHLSVLRRARIVTRLKKGRFVYYFVNRDRLKEIQAFTHALSREIHS